MEKFQLYRTALDAIQFLIVSDLGLKIDDLQFLDGLYQLFSDMTTRAVHNVVSDMVADASQNVVSELRSKDVSA